MEAQFFDHSYGFRPLREAHQAYERVGKIIHDTGYHWIIEGDISKFFDEVNHNILLGALYHMGIRDLRILQMIKSMLKAGIMNDIYKNDTGLAQGGIISPLLANVYLNKFDNFITREWEEKKFRNISRYRQNGKQKGQKATTARSIMKRKAPNMKPAYLVRYADDWVVITNSLENAKKFKRRIFTFLKTRLKLRLSNKKTKITNVKKKSIRFIGFEIRARSGKSRRGLIIHGKPDRERLTRKVTELKRDIHNFKKSRDINNLIHQINLFNSKIQGILNYYRVATHINIVLSKPGDELNKQAFRALRRREKRKTKRIPAEEVRNLKQIHKGYKTKIPAIKHKDFWIGVTSLKFGTWAKARHKTPKETIYSTEGRELYRKRTGKKRGLNRKDLTLSEKYSEIIYQKKTSNSKIYNFEFFINRGYAYNTDRGKCRVCGKVFEEWDEIETHHIRKVLPVEEINRVKNLATVHLKCHKMIHSLNDLSNELSKKVWNKVLAFRNKLGRLKL